MAATLETVEALARTTLLVRRDIYPILSETTIAAALAGTHVRLAATENALRTQNGQTALVTTAILCAQLGVELSFEFPEVALLAPQPPLRGEALQESLRDLAQDLITPATSGGGAEFEVAIGATRTVGLPGVALAGTDWGFRLDTSAIDGAFTGKLPFGAGLAAVAASAEVFRHVMVRLGEGQRVEPLLEHPLRPPRPLAYTLAPFDWRSRDVGPVDSISAGALATAALYLLLRLPGLTMQLRLMDGDTAALSNLNRYLLLRRSLLGMPKVDALASYETGAITIEPIPRRFDETSAMGILPLASKTLVGVDDIPSRWRVQAATSGWLGVAATSHFETVVSEHTAESPCAGCLHPHDDPGLPQEIPTVSFVSAMSGFLVAYRLARLAATGAGNPSQTLAYPFNFAGEKPVWELPLAARANCPVGCPASREIAS